MVQERVKILQNMPIFGGIREDILEILISEAPITFRHKNEIFFKENEKGNSMFILDSGKVVAYKSWMNNDYQLYELSAGDCFGEMELINPTTRAISIVAREDCHALEISSKHLLEIYRQDLEQFTLIQMNMGREVCRRLRTIENNLFSYKLEKNRVSQMQETVTSTINS